MPQSGEDNNGQDPVWTGRSIALVGLMGVGKTTIGRRLAKKLDLPFYDSDAEIEKASGRTVRGYFRSHGEASFREGERRVITRLLGGPPIVLSTGGGAFTQDKTRKVLLSGSLTIWLNAELDTIMARVARNMRKRPLLNVDNPKQVMRDLMDVRNPQYAQAEIMVKVDDKTHAQSVEAVLDAIKAHIETIKTPPESPCA